MPSSLSAVPPVDHADEDGRGRRHDILGAKITNTQNFAFSLVFLLDLQIRFHEEMMGKTIFPNNGRSTKEDILRWKLFSKEIVQCSSRKFSETF